MEIGYKLIKTYTFPNSWTVYRKITILGMSIVHEIREWSDMFGKHLPVLTSENTAALILQSIKYGRTTYKWVSLDYRNRLVNPWPKD
jgi:hypothetical protein